ATRSRSCLLSPAGADRADAGGALTQPPRAEDAAPGAKNVPRDQAPGANGLQAALSAANVPPRLAVYVGRDVFHRTAGAIGAAGPGRSPGGSRRVGPREPRATGR